MEEAIRYIKWIFYKWRKDLRFIYEGIDSQLNKEIEFISNKEV